MRSFKSSFSRAQSAAPERLHFAAHSHHPWPDVSRAAQITAWDDAARLLDHKWEHVFDEVLPRARAHVAATLGLADPTTVVFAPNTHEFLVRIASSFRADRPFKILSSGSEFHSFTRQAARWVEAGRAQWETVPAEPFETFAERFAQRCASGEHDLVYVSQVMFDSGWVFAEVFDVLADAAERAVCVIDGYHGFMAVPTDASVAADRVFYLAGGYKYAMSGEGVCFMHCPPGVLARPVDTGWYAGFSALAGSATAVGYALDGSRFFGSTFDPSGLYRFVAVAQWLASNELGVVDIRARVIALQERFLSAVSDGRAGDLHTSQVVPRALSTRRGNFLCFRRSDAGELADRLRAIDTICDARGDRLRLGFGIYHDPDDVERLVAAFAAIASGVR